MADPIWQAIVWFTEFVRSEPIAVPVATMTGLYMTWLLWRRWQTGTDPSVRKTTSSAVGSMAMIVSGAYATAGLAAIIAFVTWPLPIETPVLGVALLGAVTFNAILEKREDMMEGD